MDPFIISALTSAPVIMGLTQFINGCFNRATQRKQAEQSSVLQEKQFDFQAAMQERNFTEAERLQKEMSQISFENSLALQEESFKKQLAMTEYIYFRDHEWPLIPSPESHVEYLKKMYSNNRVPLQIIMTDSLPNSFGGVRANVVDFFDMHYTTNGNSPTFFYDQGWKDAMRGKSGKAQITALHKVLAGLPTLVIASDSISYGNDTEFSVRLSFWGLGDIQMPTSHRLYRKSLKELETEIDDAKTRNMALSAMIETTAAVMTDIYHLIEFQRGPLFPKLCKQHDELNNETVMKNVSELFCKFLIPQETVSEQQSFSMPLYLALTAKSFHEAGETKTAESLAHKALEYLDGFYLDNSYGLADEHNETLKLLSPFEDNKTESTFERIKNTEYDQAIANYTETIRLNPNDADAYFNRAYTYGAKGLYDQAILDYTKAIRLEPDDALAYNNRGNAYSDKGLYDQAILDYTEAIRLEPDDADAYINRGDVYNAKGLYDQAIADCTKAIRLKPDDALAYCNRGEAYNNKYLFAQAIADFTKAIQLNPNYADAYSNRSVSYELKGDYAKANEDKKKAEELKRNK
jgi:tetratricopeptide (TPR) repeat protein